MATQEKPDVNTVWASAAATGGVTAVPPEKQAQGYVDEIPFFDDFNGHMQQISQMMKHINLEGIPHWDAITEYPVYGLAKSKVDGQVYQAVSVSQNVPPVAVVGGNVNNAWRVFGASTLVAASQAEAEAGVENSKFMTALRVAQSIAKRLVQATTSIAGLAALATDAEVLAGNVANKIVTPARLLNGVVGSVVGIGYLVLPSWLGGLTLQWGNAVQTGTGINITFPRPFTNAAFVVFGQPVTGTNPANAVNLTCTIQGRTNFVAYLTQNNDYINGGFYWFALGR